MTFETPMPVPISATRIMETITSTTKMMIKRTATMAQQQIANRQTMTRRSKKGPQTEPTTIPMREERGNPVEDDAGEVVALEGGGAGIKLEAARSMGGEKKPSKTLEKRVMK